ncbi:MAG TPA: RNA polymerase sigma factor [Pirellulales bacterium]|nr:RNA polymerase sigma factor [Pirellulales bacterium]
MTDLSDHVARVFRFALRLTGNHHEAEDITQETLLRAWRKRDQLRDSAATRVWLFRIATNVWRDRVRRGRHAAGQTRPLDDEIPSDVASPAQTASARDEVRRAVEAMDSLPPRQREVLYLHACEELTHIQIAESLDTNVESVKANLSLARKKMREQLAALADDETSPSHSTT